MLSKFYRIEERYKSTAYEYMFEKNIMSISSFSPNIYKRIISVSPRIYRSLRHGSHSCIFRMARTAVKFIRKTVPPTPNCCCRCCINNTKMEWKICNKNVELKNSWKIDERLIFRWFLFFFSWITMLFSIIRLKRCANSANFSFYFIEI